VYVVADLPPIIMAPRFEDSIPTRHSLLLRLKQWDDTASWREFFETYWELIYNVARKAGLSDAEAQDVVQETVIGVARRIGDFEADPRRGSFKSWLLGQARWVRGRSAMTPRARSRCTVSPIRRAISSKRCGPKNGSNTSCARRWIGSKRG